MARADDHVRLRVQESLHDELKRVAAANGRSMNSEIVERLRKSLAGDDALTRIEAKLDAALALGKAPQ